MAMFDKTWTDVTWTNGDYISTSKMSGEVDNDKYLRDNMVGTWAITGRTHRTTEGHYTYPACWTGHDRDDYFGMKIGGETIWHIPTFEYGNWDQNSGGTWIDISNTTTYPVGVAEFRCGWLDEAHEVGLGAPFIGNIYYQPFIKTQSHKYCKCWAYVEKHNNQDVNSRVYSFTILFSHEAIT